MLQAIGSKHIQESLSSTNLRALPPSRNWLSSNDFGPQNLHLSQITDQPRIFLSDVASAGSIELLSRHKIEVVISIVLQPFERISLDPSGDSKLCRARVIDSNCGAFKSFNLNRFFLPFEDDGSNTPNTLRESFDLFSEICSLYRDKSILVHCSAGVSRSVSLVAALIARSERWSFEEAVRFISEFRHIAIKEDFAIALCDALALPIDKN